MRKRKANRLKRLIDTTQQRIPGLMGRFTNFRGVGLRFTIALLLVLLSSYGHLTLKWLMTPAAIAVEPPMITTYQSNVADLTEQGRRFYAQGQFSQAVAAWQPAVDAYQVQGKPLEQAQVLGYLALAYQKLGQLDTAETVLKTAFGLLEDPTIPKGNEQTVFAQLLNAQGNLQLLKGEATEALNIWKQATTLYAKLGDETGRIGSLINQAKAQQALGMYLQARKTLTDVQENLSNPKLDPQIRAIALHNLGDVFQATGSFEAAQTSLTQSLELTQQNQLSDEGEILLSLGNVARAQQQPDAALSYYEQAIARSRTLLTKTQAQLHQLNLWIDQRQWTKTQALTAPIAANLAQLPASRDTVYAQIYYAQTLARLRTEAAPGAPSWGTIAQGAAKAVQSAQQLKDVRAESYALGRLASFYEQNQQWQSAKKLTEKALVLAQTANASDILYQWQWQLGRLVATEATLSTSSKPDRYETAIAYYSTAVDTLQTIRNDLVAVSSDVQFSFRESVEPVYRQLVQLLLSSQQGDVSQAYLRQAREVIEALQLAQLENFFQEACLDAQAVQIDQIDRRSAVIYSIILEDHLEIILALPNQPLQLYSKAIAQADVETLLEQMQNSLRRTSPDVERLAVSEQVYDLLIRPIEPAIAESQVETLVFVLDGALQTIPVAALYDGQEYLINKYSVALAPSLQLLDPKPLETSDLTVLIAGLSEASQGFSALPGVKAEVKNVQAQLPTQVLLDQQFTSRVLQQQVQQTSFPVVHLATHGQFSSDAKETFILAWDRPINVKQLDTLLRNRETSDRRPIELLILSACQTAAGDKRAALGLAGVAVRSGARSTLATLWAVEDQSTAQVMNQFYAAIARGQVTKAEALRQAQIALQNQPDFSHPYYWAPFVLIGNWL